MFSRISIWDDEIVLEFGSGYACIILSVFDAMNCALKKLAKMVNVLCIFYYNKTTTTKLGVHSNTSISF